MHIVPSGAVSATQFIRRMRGKSQAPLIEASDTFLYVVKWIFDARSACNIRNESLRNSIYGQLGLPVASWAPVDVSHEFIQKSRGLWLNGSKERPVAGYHFGSRWVGRAEETVFDLLPTTWHERIQNRAAFWGAYVADVWTMRRDPRQAIFVEDHVSGDVRVVFIDHGSTYPVTYKSQRTNFEGLFYPDRTIYDESCRTEELHFWIQQVRCLGEAAVRTSYDSVPSEWKTASIDVFAEFLIKRIGELENLVLSASRPFHAEGNRPIRVIPKRSAPFDPGILA